MLRLGAIAIALLPVVLGVLLRHHGWGAAVGVGVAIVGGVGFTVARPHARGLVLLGTMLAVLAGLAAPQVPTALEDERVLDLRTAPVPADLRGPVAVTGYLREEWTLAEYAVPEGVLPEQDSPEAAVLVPLLGVEDGPVPLGDPVVVVRVLPGQERAPGVQTVRGHARALDHELLAAFLQASGVPDGLLPAGERPTAVLVDAVDEPRTPAWVRGSLVGLAAVGALICLWLAAVAREQPPVGRPRRRRGRGTAGAA